MISSTFKYYAQMWFIVNGTGLSATDDIVCAAELVGKYNDPQPNGALKLRVFDRVVIRARDVAGGWYGYKPILWAISPVSHVEVEARLFWGEDWDPNKPHVGGVGHCRTDFYKQLPY